MAQVKDDNLLEKYLPHFQFNEEHAIAIDAKSEQIFASLMHYDAGQDWLIRLAITMREIPLRLLILCKLLDEIAPAPFNLDKFTILEMIEGVESRSNGKNSQIAFGLVGQFWQANYGLQKIDDGTDFLIFNKPHFAKLVMVFQIENDPLQQDRDSYILTTTTRVFCPDRYSKKRFLPYWYLIRPVSGLIRRRMLSAIKAQSEK